MSTAFSSSETKGNLRSRQNNSKKEAIVNQELKVDKKAIQEVQRSWRNEDKTSQYFLVAFIILGFLTRFYEISHPNEVVFDEVHFGKFASYYLRREFFFDVHPPLAKMILALGGYLIGFDGSFLFEKIGLKYAEFNVPYVGLRSTSAIFGALNVPLVYLCMRDSGYSILPSVVATTLVLLDGSLITQSRLILLDSQLVFFATLSVYCYIRFYKYKFGEFTQGWWFWLIATGVSLALTLGTKMVGLFTILTIGAGVIFELWSILDIKKGYSMNYVGKHFGARAFGLIAVPIMVYLSLFWIHFKVLNHSGTGDAYMSPDFQQTLEDNDYLVGTNPIKYGDFITIKHKSTKNYLHSHFDRYPRRYEDGKISSAGQQVTCYPHKDSNNYWRITPKEDPKSDDEDMGYVRNGDTVRLFHVGTRSYLMTHDVASPTKITNEEMTTVDINIAKNDTEQMKLTYFKIQVDTQKEGEIWKTRSHYTKFLHIETPVAIWTHNTKLPDWGFGHNEVSGSKDLKDPENDWFIDEIINREVPTTKREPIHRNFFLKFWELQREMLIKNNQISADHPYATRPWMWPITFRGCSYWTRDTSGKKEQIYLLGNPFGYLFGTLTVLAFISYLIADQFLIRRGYIPPDPVFHSRLYKSGAFFLLAWGLHYLPFNLMGRQLFLHHYLPALIFKYLLVGATFQFVFYSKVDYTIPDHPKLLEDEEIEIELNTSNEKSNNNNNNNNDNNTLSDHIQLPTTLSYRQTLPVKTPLLAYVFALLLISIQLLGFYYYAPFIYGFGLNSGNEVINRKLLNSWDFQFAKKETKAEDKPTKATTDEIKVDEPDTFNIIKESKVEMKNENNHGIDLNLNESIPKEEIPLNDSIEKESVPKENVPLNDKE